MTIRRTQVASLLDALLGIVPSEGRPLNISTKTRYALMKNVRLLSSAFNEIERTMQKIVRRLSPETFKIDKEKNPDLAARYTVESEEYMGQEIDIALFTIKLSDLNVYDPKENPEGNDIPISILAKLGPIVEEDAA